MPTYEYECRKCSHQFELFQQMKAEPVKICPKCKGELRRLIGAGAGIIFKGSGFYATDYPRKAKIGQEKSACGSSNSCPASCPNKK